MDADSRSDCAGSYHIVCRVRANGDTPPTSVEPITVGPITVGPSIIGPGSGNRQRSGVR